MWASTVAHSNMLGFEGDFACHALSHVFTTELGLPHGAGPGYPDDRMVQVYAHR